MLQTFVEDARDAVRVLRATPLFTATAALSLAIGIGANTTIFSAANALLLRASPGHSEPRRVVDVGRTQGGVGFDTVSYPNYRDLRQRVTQLSGIYAYTMEPHAMSPGPRETRNVFTVPQRPVTISQSWASFRDTAESSGMM